MAIILLSSCDKSSLDRGTTDGSPVALSSVAIMLAELPMTGEHYSEVFDAVSSSDGNGYDEEYLMKDIFACPGKGVGDATTKSGTSYPHPLRNLIMEHCSTMNVKSSTPIDLVSLENSDIQIYWPYASSWDHKTAPIITFDPNSDDVNTNIGYELVTHPDGTRDINIVKVSEETAKERPVWVINNNDDSEYESLEMLRKETPGWGEGGNIVVTKSSETEFKTLVLRKIKMNRQYDSWFAGASEFFIKIGGIEGFTASTEAEMRLFSPSVTDFMVSIKRKQLAEWVSFDAVLISKWSENLEELAFMVTEDDGGTRTSWKFEAMVKINSKSYGVDMEIPLNQRDDIVWRGGLSSMFLERYQGEAQHFGGVDLVFDFI